MNAFELHRDAIVIDGLVIAKWDESYLKICVVAG